jgi:hypothetical protein
MGAVLCVSLACSLFMSVTKPHCLYNYHSWYYVFILVVRLRGLFFDPLYDLTIFPALAGVLSFFSLSSVVFVYGWLQLIFFSRGYYYHCHSSLPFSSLYVFLWLAFAPYSLGVWTVSLRKCILWTRRWI